MVHSLAALGHGTWDLPRSGMKPVSIALTGRFFSPEPPGKPKGTFRIGFRVLHLPYKFCNLNPGSSETLLLTNFLLLSLDLWTHLLPLCFTNTSSICLHPDLHTFCPICLPSSSYWFQFKHFSLKSFLNLLSKIPVLVTFDSFNLFSFFQSCLWHPSICVFIYLLIFCLLDNGNIFILFSFPSTQTLPGTQCNLMKSWWTEQVWMIKMRKSSWTPDKGNISTNVIHHLRMRCFRV